MADIIEKSMSKIRSIRFRLESLGANGKKKQLNNLM